MSDRGEDGRREGRRASRALLLAAVLAMAAHSASFLGSGPVDDDYILYRYARNLLEGHGLVFNAGERVEGFTEPLMVLALAGAMALGAVPWVASLAIGIASAAAATWAVGRTFLRAVPGSRWPVPAFLVAATPAFAWHSVAGLGTALFAALLALWFGLYHRAAARGGSLVPASLALGLAGAVRAEAALFIVPFAAWELARRRRIAALFALVPLAGWCAFRWVYYGRFLPVTYLVKKLPLAADLRYGLAYLWRSTYEAGIGLLLLLALVLLFRRRRAAAGRAVDPFTVATTGVLLHALYVVYVGGDYIPFPRFFMPVFPLLVLLASLAARELLAARPALQKAAFWIPLIAVQATQLGRGQLFGAYALQEHRWIAIGRTLRDAVPPDATIALSPVGAIPYFSRLAVVDMLGLTNDAVWRAEPDLSIAMKAHHRYDAGWVLAREPDLVILGNGILAPGSTTVIASAWERTLLAHPRFQSDYEPIAMPIEGSYPLVLFRRADGAMPRGADPIELWR